MADDNMPPRPECEFDFNFSHGFGTDEDIPGNNQCPISQSDQDYQKSLKNDIHDHQSDHYQDGRILEGHIFSCNRFNDSQADLDSLKDALSASKLDINVNMDHSLTPIGFPDTGAESVFDNSGADHQLRKALPKDGKSPRRCSDDDDYDASQRTKRPRQSLLSSSVERDAEGQADAYSLKQGVAKEIAMPRRRINNDLSSLKITQQNGQHDPSEPPVDLEFDLNGSGRTKTAHQVSPAPTEDSVLIPLNDQVGGPPQWKYTLFSIAYQS